MQVRFVSEDEQLDRTLNVRAVPRVGDGVFWMDEVEAVVDGNRAMVGDDSMWLVTRVLWSIGPSARAEDSVATVTLQPEG